MGAGNRRRTGRGDQLVSDWKGVTNRIATEQGFKWPRIGASASQEVAQFLEPAPAKAIASLGYDAGRAASSPDTVSEALRVAKEALATMTKRSYPGLDEGRIRKRCEAVFDAAEQT